MNTKGVSQIISAVLLVAVATVAATGYYLWFTNLQKSTQTEVGENVKKSALRQLNELGIYGIPIYYFEDSKFVQEVALELENLGVTDYSGVQVRIMGVEANGSFEWMALQLKDDRLLDTNGSEAGSVKCPKNTGITFYRKDGKICSLNFTPEKEKLHIPTYDIGSIGKGEIKEALVYIFINSTVPNEILVKIYASSREGAEAYKLIKFMIR